jgi:hypothetical protein
MPRGAGGKPSKLYGLGLLGGVGSGVGSGLLWHLLPDPPQWVMYIVEVAIAVVVAFLLLPRSPQTPNLNPIPQLIDAH